MTLKNTNEIVMAKIKMVNLVMAKLAMVNREMVKLSMSK
jgi:hypothetical protein